MAEPTILVPGEANREWKEDHGIYKPIRTVQVLLKNYQPSFRKRRPEHFKKKWIDAEVVKENKKTMWLRLPDQTLKALMRSKITIKGKIIKVKRNRIRGVGGLINA